MNAKRLLKLADFLDTVPREKFDFGSIVWQGGKPPREALKAGRSRCGTTACAVGWMPVVFPRLTEWEKLSGEAIGVRLRADVSVTDFLAAADVFEISESDAGYLFHPGDSGLGERATPKQVARHIRKFVREREAAA